MIYFKIRNKLDGRVYYLPSETYDYTLKGSAWEQEYLQIEGQVSEIQVLAEMQGVDLAELNRKVDEGIYREFDSDKPTTKKPRKKGSEPTEAEVELNQLVLEDNGE